MEKESNNRPGRPESEIKMEMHCLRTFADEWKVWEQAAKARGMKRSEYIRQTMNRSAKRTLSGLED